MSIVRGLEIVDSIDDIPIQDPAEGAFSSVDLKWVKFGTPDHYDDVAKIPYDRVGDFIFGESSNVEFPTKFHIEKSGKCDRGSPQNYKDDDYLENKRYWCSFGPENYGEDGDILPSRRYRLNTRNRAARAVSMRGCQCHFEVKRFYAWPSLALVYYKEKRHVNKSGLTCHGPLDRNAIGPGAKNIPYVGTDIQQQTMSMIYLGIPEEDVIQKHLEGIQRYCSSDAKVDRVSSQYVRTLEQIIKRSSYELDLDDKKSVQLWAKRNEKSVFFYQDSSEADQFVLGIQTNWQRQQMIRFGHCSIIAADTSFGLKKLKYPLYTLLVFDSRYRAIPVAWVITRSSSKTEVAKWMKALVDQVRSVDSGWKVSGFVIDDAAAELEPIRDIFSCPVLFSLWRIRKTWLRSIVKRCSVKDVRREIFKRLGDIITGIWNGLDYALANIDKLMQDFVDQTSFIEYFKDSWLPKIEMWLSLMRSVPLASQEAASAIEAYHVKLKNSFYDDSHLGAFKRVDWLVHKLTTELHSSYLLALVADERDIFSNVNEINIPSTSWHRALQIPDTAVCIFDDNLFAKVLSLKDNNLSRIVWNPGSEFAFCDCPWSLQGNLCKHVIKVSMMCQNRQGSQASLSSHSFRELLTTLLRKPMDDSIELDKAMAWTQQVLDHVQRLVELTKAQDISNVVNNLPLKWVSRKSRASSGKPRATLALPCTSQNDGNSAAPGKSRRKRKRLSRVR